MAGLLEPYSGWLMCPRSRWPFGVPDTLLMYPQISPTSGGQNQRRSRDPHFLGDWCRRCSGGTRTWRTAGAPWTTRGFVRQDDALVQSLCVRISCIGHEDLCRGIKYTVVFSQLFMHHALRVMLHFLFFYIIFSMLSSGDSQLCFREKCWKLRLEHWQWGGRRGGKVAWNITSNTLGTISVSSSRGCDDLRSQQRTGRTGPRPGTSEKCSQFSTWLLAATFLN